MFRPVGSKVDFPRLEEGVLALWREQDVFKKSLSLREGSQAFILYEGPPTANGSPGIHHVLARVFKDIIPRYKTMRGFYCPRRAGWDTHGLPVELEVERELGLSRKGDIEAFGIDKFNVRCKESVLRYRKEWEALTERIGFWVDMEDAYITYDNRYIESCWWVIKELWEKGLLYQGYRVTPHCPRCVTSLSSHEVALGYKEDARDPSIYVKFRVSYPPFAQPTFLLAWTTTPWTLPGNTALAVAPEADYALVRVKTEEGEQQFILAQALLEKVLKHPYEIAGTYKGREVAGFEYEPLFSPEPTPSPSGRYPLVEADFVSLEEGTGIVHIAPAFGEQDYNLGQAKGIYFVQPVDLQGIMHGEPAYDGKFVKDADRDIIRDLKLRGLLYRQETIVHTYPFCWRCDSPLLYYAKASWYIKTTAKKEDLIARNQEVNWYPEHIREGRFGEWLRNNEDWALSRERYWGTPLPLWRCQGCGHIEAIGGIEDIKRLAHHEAMAGEGNALEECLKDLHRPFIDKIILKCPKSKPGARHQPDTMRRVPEVIDAWFDSGAMPYAQLHYPFENEGLFEERFPADYICEGIDQTRGWFYTLHALSTLLYNQPCFRNVLCLGHILDAKGEKMSKSKGNVVKPWEVIKAYGADPLRWYLFTSSPPGLPRRFSEAGILEEVRRFFLPLWNVYSFFVTYANIDRFTPSAELPSFQGRTSSELDRWITSRLHSLISGVTQALEGYDPTSAGRRIETFVDDLSDWYVRRSRRRFWKSENDQDKLSAYSTLYRCLEALARLLAPFTPFLAEELYQNLVRSWNDKAPESVHLADYPVSDPALIDEELEKATELAILVSSLGRNARSQAGLKVRLPLSRIVVRVTSPKERTYLERMAPQILEELNVKELALGDGELPQEGYTLASDRGVEVAVATTVPPELAQEGLARELVHRLQNMRRAAGFELADRIITYWHTPPALRSIIEKFSSYICQETLSLELVEGLPPSTAFSQKHTLDGHEVILGVEKLPTASPPGSA